MSGRRPRVVQLSDYGGPYPGSFVPMLRAIARAADRRGWDVELVFTPLARDRPWLDELRADGTSVRVLAADRRRHRAAVRALGDDRAGPAVLHTHFTAFDLAAALATVRRSRTRAFWHLHHHVRNDLRVRAQNVVKYPSFGRLVDGILCVAPDVAESTRRRLAPRDRVAFFPNAIDTSRFPLRASGDCHAARAALGLPADATVLLHYGWDWQRKGGDLFLGAAARVARGRDAPVVAVTVGAPPEARELAARLGLEHLRIEEPTDRLAPLLAAADVFVSSSRAEGMPFSIAEALCSGVPVAATDIPGQRVQCRGLEACRLAALDEGDLARAISELLARDTVSAADAGVAAREIVRDRLDLEPWSERVIDLYDRALDGASGRRLLDPVDASVGSAWT